MINEKTRTSEEKEAFRVNAILSGVNPYNVLSPAKRKSTGKMVERIQYIGNKVIKHFN